VLAVADDGPGVPDADRERVFEPFFTTKAGGTGLGLAMAERIVRAHGGRLRVVPGAGAGPGGAGACFELALPRAAAVGVAA
jgi:signal transduction histidine kinase